MEEIKHSCAMEIAMEINVLFINLSIIWKSITP